MVRKGAISIISILGHFSINLKNITGVRLGCEVLSDTLGLSRFLIRSSRFAI